MPNREKICQPEYYIGVDVGTGSVRTALIDESGEILALADAPIKTWKPQVGYHEQSTTDIWRRVCECVHRVVQDAKVDPSQVRGLGFDATCSLAVLSSESDEPISVTGPDFVVDGDDRNVVLWLDHRAQLEVEQINATAHRLLRFLGGKMNVEMQIAKVLWLKHHMPPKIFSRCRFYNLVDAMTQLATGNQAHGSPFNIVCKPTHDSVGLDGSVKGWHHDFYRDVGLEELAQDSYRMMGGVNRTDGSFWSAGDIVGTLSEQASRELGLQRDVNVGSGVIDAYAGWIGTVGSQPYSLAGIRPQAAESDGQAERETTDETIDATNENQLAEAFTRLASVAGTSTCHMIMLRHPIFVDGICGPFPDAVLPGFSMAEGGQSATGELLRHVIESHPAYAEAMVSARQHDQGIHDFLNCHLSRLTDLRKAPFITFLGRHLFFYGDLWGNRSPVRDNAMRGAVVGLDSDVSVDALALHYYAAMEFIALQTRQIIETINGAGHLISSIYLSGSQGKNTVMVKLLATACSMPVVIPVDPGAAVVFGAALLGARAARLSAQSADDVSAGNDGDTDQGEGQGVDLWEIMTRMTRPGAVVRPSEDDGERVLLGVKYEVMLEMCESQRKYRKTVDTAMEPWLH